MTYPYHLHHRLGHALTQMQSGHASHGSANLALQLQLQGIHPDKGTEEPMQRENGCTPGPSTL